ncbi:hypothetical protein ABT126_43285 [Streptomyces sp. NPDC002012]|uniref:hypothetical protein n=1 Tax=unclassified Streptomyces TaxID=2593676 RepID=UPI00333142D0
MGDVAADDVGEVGSTLLFAGRDGVEASFSGGVDPRDLGPQGGDLAVGAADLCPGAEYGQLWACRRLDNGGLLVVGLYRRSRGGRDC